MDKQQVLLLFLQALVKEASDAGFLMRKITLLKYLYLLDVYMAQETGSKFTDINWIFWTFGPYANDGIAIIDKIVENKLVVVETIETRFDNNLIQYKPIADSPTRKEIWRLFPPQVLNKIFNIDLKRFWDDTYKLLDYVYFDTQPMMNVKPGDKLNFVNLDKDIEIESISLNPISKTKAKKVQELFARRKQPKSHQLFPKFNDTLLQEFDTMFFAENPMNNFSGTVELK